MAGPAIPAALKTAVQSSVKAFDDIVAKRGGVAGKTPATSGQALQNSTGLSARSPGGAEASASSRPRISLRDAVGMAQEKLAPGAFSEASRSPHGSAPQSPSLMQQAMVPFQHAAHQVVNSFVPPAFQGHLGAGGGGVPPNGGGGGGGMPPMGGTSLHQEGQMMLNQMRSDTMESVRQNKQMNDIQTWGSQQLNMQKAETELKNMVASNISSAAKKLAEAGKNQ